MAKPIPVFAFIFAAYAATSKAGAAPALGEQMAQRPSCKDLELCAARARAKAFALAWVRRPDPECYLVKVRLAGCACAPGLRPAGREDGRDGATDEVWLGAISETLHGFAGVVDAESGPCSKMWAGETVIFDEADIVDWRERAPAQHSPEGSGEAIVGIENTMAQLDGAIVGIMDTMARLDRTINRISGVIASTQENVAVTKRVIARTKRETAGAEDGDLQNAVQAPTWVAT
jgi:hypothetical protein